MSGKENPRSLYLRAFCISVFSCFLVCLNLGSSNAQVNSFQDSGSSSNIHIKNYSTYEDTDKKSTIMVGSVSAPHNITLNSPVEVTLGLKVYNNSSKDYVTIIKEHTYKKTIYDFNEPIPFKFTINSSKFYLRPDSIPFIYNIAKADLPHSPKINTFELNYNEALLGPNNELYGTVKNTAPSTIKNLTLYAIVHDKKGTQVDSVKTVIPAIKPQETAKFSFIPNKAIKGLVHVYSCVGGELQDINTYQVFNLSSNKTLGYKFSGLMEINSIDYDNKTNQFELEVNNLYPIPASLSLQLNPEQRNHLSFEIDNHAYSPTIANTNKVTTIEMSIPQGKHEINVSNFDG